MHPFLISFLRFVAHGQLFHSRLASGERYAPTAQCLPVQAMEISSHSFSAPRGAPARVGPARGPLGTELL